MILFMLLVTLATHPPLEPPAGLTDLPAGLVPKTRGLDQGPAVFRVPESARMCSGVLRQDRVYNPHTVSWAPAPGWNSESPQHFAFLSRIDAFGIRICVLVQPLRRL